MSLQRKRPDTSRGDFIISFTPNTSSNLRSSSLCLIQILSNISENGHVLTDVIHFTMESGSPHFVIGYFSMDRFFSVQQEEYIPANLKYCYRFFPPSILSYIVNWNEYSWMLSIAWFILKFILLWILYLCNSKPIHFEFEKRG